ncbi:barstar family protein [Streptomyces sp. SDT5-1]|uniref:barstar family protein n=1 Tax=Streptomyces sp. SDT5-1 TaxID=3406418 RepID=UPI003FD2DD93
MSGLPASPDLWTVRQVDLTGATDKTAFMDRCAAALGLPEWFGRNWDALADCLSDPGVWPASDRTLVVVVSGWRDFEGRCPDVWGTALDVFEDAVGRREDSEPALGVLLALR